MITKLLEYRLPLRLIAQHPALRRDQARLLVVNRSDSSIRHQTFADLPELLRPDDLLILNDTKVLPARLLGRRVQTAGRWEGLFIREHRDGSWELLCQTRGRLRPGESIIVDRGALVLQLIEKTKEGHWLARPEPTLDSPADALTLLAQHGHPPLPPYIRKGRPDPQDADRYQTVFARQLGAIAAPTAGLHFTAALLNTLEARAIDHAFVTLHVGTGTFQPIQDADFRQHRMHAEYGILTAITASRIDACRRARGRIIAVGTTTTRVLESVAASGPLRPWQGLTDLYIYPPFHFQAVDALITNFHLPRSTLLLLVGAFAGIELTYEAYMKAIESDYRFYSYGDAMLIL